MARRYRTIEHTADVGLIAWGRNLSEAFINAACGMTSIMVDMRTVRPSIRVDIVIEEDDPEKLLFEWLNRILYYFDTRSIIFKKYDMVYFTCNRLEANCYGEKYNPERHALKTGIKSATFHRILVDSKKNRIRVILDI